MRMDGVDVVQLIGSIGMVAVTIALVIVTLKYAKSTRQLVEATHDAVEEARKDRRLELIESRLHNLYYPLKLHMDNMLDLHQWLPHVEDRFYLASADLMELLEKFRKLPVRTFAQMISPAAPPRIGENKILWVGYLWHAEIQKVVKQEVKEFVKELDMLTTKGPKS